MIDESNPVPQHAELAVQQLPHGIRRVNNEQTAHALAKVWREFGYFTKIRMGPGRLYWEVQIENAPENFNDLTMFFLAGRVSLALTAD